jgi:hypothetical protein
MWSELVGRKKITGLVQKIEISPAAMENLSIVIDTGPQLNALTVHPELVKVPLETS